VFTVFIATSMGSRAKADKNEYMSIIVNTNEEIPQGKFIYELYFSEWNGRMDNLKVEIVINENNIIVFNNKEKPLTGGNIIIEGILIKHKSGKWIIAENEDDGDEDEIGGCTGGPVPIDFETKIIEWC